MQKPAFPILTSGKESFPVQRPIAAGWADSKGKKGRIAVVGSAHFAEDAYIDQEDNWLLLEYLSRWLAGLVRAADLAKVDSDEADTSESQPLPDTERLAERIRVCLQENDELPRDFTRLFNDSLFKFDTNLIPEAVELYSALGVRKAPLTLIPPKFEAPLPPLGPAVYPPLLREPPPPALDLFDLDEHFAGERTRLAALTNKCLAGGAEDLNVRLLRLRGGGG